MSGRRVGQAGTVNLGLGTAGVIAATGGKFYPWLKRMQYRPGLIDGFLAKTGLDLALS